VVLARERFTLDTRIFVLREEYVEIVALVLELTSFFVSAVSSLFHGSAPVVGKVWGQWSVGHGSNPRPPSSLYPTAFQYRWHAFWVSRHVCFNTADYGRMSVLVGINGSI